MDNVMDIDWREYFHRLSDDQMRDLATWLAADFLKVSEFTDIVDRVYAQAPTAWHGRSADFVAYCGRSVVEGYAHRKRRFAQLRTALEDAYMSGAFPGDVASWELEPLQPPWTEPLKVADLLGVLERARGGSG